MFRSALRIALAGLALATAADLKAQGMVWPAKKDFIAIGEAFGTGSGGVLSGTTWLQVMRVSAVKSIGKEQAIDLTAVRLQTVFPPGGRANDFEYANPEADALILSFANLQSTRARGIPNEAAIGIGVARRNTSEPGRTRDTWIGHAGFDATPFSRWPRGDAAVGFHLYLMPTNTNSLVYIATLGLVLRIG